jgi:hypothetical protein
MNASLHMVPASGPANIRTGSIADKCHLDLVGKTLIDHTLSHQRKHLYPPLQSVGR